MVSARGGWGARCDSRIGLARAIGTDDTGEECITKGQYMQALVRFEVCKLLAKHEADTATIHTVDFETREFAHLGCRMRSCARKLNQGGPIRERL
jgi:hypothetical protein